MGGPNSLLSDHKLSSGSWEAPILRQPSYATSYCRGKFWLQQLTPMFLLNLHVLYIVVSEVIAHNWTFDIQYSHIGIFWTIGNIKFFVFLVSCSRPSGDYLSKPWNWPLCKENLLWPLSRSGIPSRPGERISKNHSCFFVRLFWDVFFVWGWRFTTWSGERSMIWIYWKLGMSGIWDYAFAGLKLRIEASPFNAHTGRTGRLVGPFSSPHNDYSSGIWPKFVGIHFLLNHRRTGHSKMSCWSLRDAYSIIFNLLSLLEGELCWYWIFMHYLGGGFRYIYFYVHLYIWGNGSNLTTTSRLEMGKSPGLFPWRSKSGSLCLIFFGTAFDKQEVPRSCEWEDGDGLGIWVKGTEIKQQFVA